MRLGDRDAEQAGAMQISIVLDRECCVAIIGGRATCEYRLAEFACTRDDRCLFRVQAEGAGIEDRRIEGNLVGRGWALADLPRHLCFYRF